MKHRRGTPGLIPYRLRTIEVGYPQRRRPARHLRHDPRNLVGSHLAMVLAAATAFVLLVAGGYQALAGAAIVLGMF